MDCGKKKLADMKYDSLLRVTFYPFVFLSTLGVGMLAVDRMNSHTDRVVHPGYVGPFNTPLALGDATIVTAYFEFPSKHTNGEFSSWMRNMLSLQDPMVIFTTQDKVETFYRMRGHALNRTLVVVMQLADAEVVRWYGMDFWSAQHNIDPARTVNVNPWLYVVWNEKLNFVSKAIHLNPFNSAYFVWMDVGLLRHPGYNGKRLAIDSTPFAGDRVLMLDITAMTHNIVPSDSEVESPWFSLVPYLVDRVWAE